MDFLDLVKKRRATHHFEKGFKLSEEDFKKIIEYTRFTPSGYNAQPWEFILIQDEDRIKEIGKIAFNQTQIVEAGNAIVVLGDLNIGRNADALLEDWVKYGYCTPEEVPVYKNTFTKPRPEGRLRQMALRNASFAAITLIYVAEALGFQTCPMMGVSQPKLLKFLEVPEDRIIALLIAIGKGIREKEKPQLPRKEVETMIWKEKFGVRF